MVIRPIGNSDLQSLFELIQCAKPGLTSLPKDKSLLDNLIQRSLSSFHTNGVPNDPLYFFVLEDQATKAIVGSACIYPQIGVKRPFYSFEIKEIKKVSESLSTSKDFRLLTLYTTVNGPSEIGGLYLSPSCRGQGLGRFLSLARFLFMAAFPQYFQKEVIAEMRGFCCDEGRSPFWTHVGRQFFDMTFKEADLMSSRDHQFIEDLVPRYPIYVHLLPSEAQAAIGASHPNTKPAISLLKNEGFKQTSHIDIFDGGPKLICPIEDIRLIRESHHVVVTELNDDLGADDTVYLIGNKEFGGFRVVQSVVRQLGDGQISLTPPIATELGARVGDALIISPLYLGKR